MSVPAVARAWREIQEGVIPPRPVRAAKKRGATLPVFRGDQGQFTTAEKYIGGGRSTRRMLELMEKIERLKRSA